MTVFAFQQALNSEILPRLNIETNQEARICHQTATRWLHRLSFSLKTSQKGVYIDGHEREDIIKYRQEVFLPLMEKLDRCACSLAHGAVC